MVEDAWCGNHSPLCLQHVKVSKHSGARENLHAACFSFCGWAFQMPACDHLKPWARSPTVCVVVFKFSPELSAARRITFLNPMSEWSTETLSVRCCFEYCALQTLPFLSAVKWMHSPWWRWDLRDVQSREWTERSAFTCFQYGLLISSLCLIFKSATFWMQTRFKPNCFKDRPCFSHASEPWWRWWASLLALRSHWQQSRCVKPRAVLWGMPFCQSSFGVLAV